MMMFSCFVVKLPTNRGHVTLITKEFLKYSGITYCNDGVISNIRVSIDINVHKMMVGYKLIHIAKNKTENNIQ